MKDFFKMFFASLLAMAFVSFGGFLMFFILVSALSSLSTTTQVSVASDSVLVFDMSCNIQDSPVNDQEQEFLGALGQGGPAVYSLRDVVRAIDAAANDGDIKGLYLRGQFNPMGYGSGYASLKEVRRAIVRFKDSGKPVLANVIYPTARELYLTSAADTVFMNPDGMSQDSGMASQPFYLGSFFKKYGINVQVTRAGAYKSAVESFTLDKMSEPAREQTTALLEAVWSDYVSTIGEKTGLSREDFEALLNAKGILDADAALACGLVDRLAQADEVIAELQRVGSMDEDDGYNGVSLSQYIKSKRKHRSSKDGFVAVVYAEGDIVYGEGEKGQVGGDSLSREIRELRKNDKVKAIVLRVNSPGGSALASEQIQYELRKANETLPVIVSMGTYAASGGYWISAYADKIYAEPTTVTGSIGVFGMFFNFEEIASRHGINFDLVKTTKYADLGSIARPINPEEMALIQNWVDKTYDQFLDKVSEGRGQERVAIEKIAGGRVWAGSDAVKIGLVDELGGLGEAIAFAGTEGGLGDKPAVREFPKPRDFFQELLKNLPGGSFASRYGALAPVAEAVEEVGSLANRFNDPKGVYSVLPYRIDPQ